MSGKTIFHEIEGYDEIRAQAAQDLPPQGTRDHVHASRTVEKIHPGRLKLVVEEVRNETPTTITVRLGSAVGYLPPFQAGQYISLFVEVNDVSTCRPYSITSPPSARKYYELTIKRMPDSFVSGHLIDSLKKGAVLETTAPDGQFYYNPLVHGQDLVMLAGGSGITPIISMIRDLTVRRPDIRISLLYGSATPAEIVFGDELAALEKAGPNFRVCHVISEPPAGFDGQSGYITAELVREIAPRVGSSTFFVCGPEAMYHFCLAELNRMGVAGKRIRTELSGPPGNVENCDGWPPDLAPGSRVNIRVNGGSPFEARVSEPLLVALERNRQSINAACRTGQCSMCRVRVESGEIFEAPGSGQRRSDRWFGYAHACMTYPITDLEISL